MHLEANEKLLLLNYKGNAADWQQYAIAWLEVGCGRILLADYIKGNDITAKQITDYYFDDMAWQDYEELIQLNYKLAESVYNKLWQISSEDIWQQFCTRVMHDYLDTV